MHPHTKKNDRLEPKALVENLKYMAEIFIVNKLTDQIEQSPNPPPPENGGGGREIAQLIQTNY